MIDWLVPEQASTFAHLATDAVAMGLPYLRHPSRACLELKATSHLAAGLYFAGVPAGLVVLRLDPQAARGHVTILSLVVAQPFWRLGLARDLLAWIRDQAPRWGWQSLSLGYPLHHACSAAMERLTNPTDGWHQELGLRLVRLNREGAKLLLDRLNPVLRENQRSGRFVLTAWNDLPDGVRNDLGPRLQAPAWAVPVVDDGEDPLQTLDPQVSSVLSDGQRPCGWLMTHRVGPQLLRVSQWWVEPGLQGTGRALLLLQRALSVGLASPRSYAVTTFGMTPNNRRAIRLCRKKIEPLAVEVIQQRHVWLDLSMADHV